MTRSATAPETVTLQVPFRVVKRGGRKGLQLPASVKSPQRTDNTLVKALARAFRWKRMLDSGDFATINELAEREGIAPSYMTRVMRLTLLTPNIVEAILSGRTGPEVMLAWLLEPFPVEWREQGAAPSRGENRGAHPAQTCRLSAPAHGVGPAGAARPTAVSPVSIAKSGPVSTFESATGL